MPIPRSLGFFCLAFFLLPASAQPAGSVSPLVETAAASVFAEHASGCVLLNLQASRVKRGHEVGEQVLTVSLFRSASVAGCGEGPELELLASGQANRFELAIEPRLTGARLKATVGLAMERSGAILPFEINVAWTGVGGQLYAERPGSSIAHVHGYGRAAKVNATIADGATDYVANAFQSEGVLNVSTVFTSGAAAPAAK
jgi:hypothetical protein